MKKTAVLLIVLLLGVAFKSNSQISIPKQLNWNDYDTSNIKLSQVYENYRQLKLSGDSSLNSHIKDAERWMFNVNSRLSIDNDSTYNFDDYSKAYKLLVESELFCNDEDVSDWTDIGPRNHLDQSAGWVSAVYRNEDPNNEYYLAGGRMSGIFKRVPSGDPHWTCVTDALDFPVVGVQQIISFPNDPSRLMAIMGTNSGLEPVQNGYLVSSDHGDTWTLGTQYIDGGQLMSPLVKMQFYTTPSNQVVVFAITYDQIILSIDGGVSWSQVGYPGFPTPFDGSFGNLIDLAVSGNMIHIVQDDKIYANVFYWAGEIYFNNGGFIDVNWSQENSSQFYPPVPVSKLIDDNSPFSYTAQIVNSNQLGSDPTEINAYQHRYYGATGCGYTGPPHNNTGVGLWTAIRTQGWEIQQTLGVNKLTSIKSDSTYDGSEVVMSSFNLPVSFWNASDLITEVNCVLPEGVKLTVYISSLSFYSGVNTPPDPNLNPWSNVCLYDNYDYSVLFQNKILETDWGTTSGGASIIFQENFSLFDHFLKPPGYMASSDQYRFYFKLEFNANYNSGDLFVLNEFDVREFTPKVHSLTFSNNVENRFYVHSVVGGKFSAIYKTLDQGQTFTALVNQTSGNYNIVPDDGNFLKNELIASIADSNVFYHGSIHSPQRYIENDVEVLNNLNASFGGSGHHADYRSSYITLKNGSDHIIFGNDGGVGTTENANLSTLPAILSINGDIGNNLIYNLDVDEKTKRIIIGLQDNGTRYFSENDLGMTYLGGGDGCVTYSRKTGTNFVGGDPQFGASAIKDLNIPGMSDGGIVGATDLNDSEVYLGMRLEPYRFTDHEEKFISGLSKKDESSTASVFINTGVDTHLKSLVPGSVLIGSIGLCQRDPKYMYAVEGIPRGQHTTRFYRSTDEGITWLSVNSNLILSTHSTTINEGVAWKFINALGVDHDDPNLVYIGMSGIGEINQVVTNEYFRVLRSFDGGDNFTDWSQGLPALPVNYLLPIESEKHIIFCATDAGVYYRMDGMHQWECFSNHLAKTRITDLVYNYCSRELYASTYGRGVWKTPVNLETYSSYSEEIVGNQTWNTDRDVRSNILVTTGSTLTITSTVHVDADRKFIVEPGAKLIIDNGTLTNACGQYWKGIEVWGNGSLSQTPQNQGHLITRNNAKIEFAREAIATWKQGDWSTSGGIVQCTNTEFKNNRTSAYFYPYYNENPNNGNEVLNVGFMTNCQFIWDDNYIDESPEAGVIMYKVNGVKIKGSDFLDNRLVLDQFNLRPKGIFSLDAGYKVLARATQLTLAPHEIFATTGGYDVNNFKNLEYGVYALGANSVTSITVDHCKFENVTHSISLSAVDNAVLTRNLVEFTPAHPADIGSSQGFGISVSKGFTVEGNTFNSSVPNGASFGVLTWDTGSENNKIYRNFYNNQGLANYAYGNNSNTDPNTVNLPQTLSGLTWECNEGNNNKYDLASFAQLNIDGQGAKLLQGANNYPIGNKFTDPSSPSLAAQLLHTDSETMLYFYQDEVLQNPSVNAGNVTVILATEENLCLSRIHQIFTIREDKPFLSTNATEISLQVTQLEQEILTKKAELAANLANGDAPNLHQLVANLAPNNKQAVRTALLAASPYLSQSLLQELGNASPGAFSHAWYKGVIEANIEVTRSDAFMQFLQNKAVPLPNGLYNQIAALRYTMFTNRGELEMQINRLIAERDERYNWLITHELSENTEVNWTQIKNLIVLRDNEVCRAEVGDKFLGVGKITECLNVLDAIDQNSSGYQVPYVQQEMQDFSTFKRYVLSITNNTGKVEALDSTQIEQLSYIANNFKGRSAIQARNILCFHAGLCEERQVVLPPNAMQIITSQNSGLSGAETQTLGLSVAELKVIPNPNTGEFVLEVPNTCVITELSIVDVHGRAVMFETSEQIENRSRIVVNNHETGILFLKATCSDGSIYTSRILVSK